MQCDWRNLFLPLLQHFKVSLLHFYLHLIEVGENDIFCCVQQHRTRSILLFSPIELIAPCSSIYRATPLVSRCEIMITTSLRGCLEDFTTWKMGVVSQKANPNPIYQRKGKGKLVRVRLSGVVLIHRNVIKLHVFSEPSWLAWMDHFPRWTLEITYAVHVLNISDYIV